MKQLFVKTAILFFMIMASGLLYAQEYIPQEGENILFFPVNKSNENSNFAYDCFYSGSCIKNNSFSFKSKDRYRRNQFDLTPLTEIEDYTFKVLEQKILYADNPKKKTLLLLLERREDKDLLVLRVPYYNDKKSNKITMSWQKPTMIGYYLAGTDINIPFINIDTLNAIKNRFINKKIHLHKRYEKNEENYITLGNEDERVDFILEYSEFTCTDITFYNIGSTFIYKQLYAQIVDKNKAKFNVPVCNLVGNVKSEFCNKNKLSNILEKHFKTKDEYISANEKKLDMDRIKKIKETYTGKSVYYGLSMMFRNNLYYSTDDENCFLETNKKYELEQGYYQCESFDFLPSSNRKNGFYQFFAILVDNKGARIRIIAAPKANYSLSRDADAYFDSYFLTREEAELKKEEQDREKNEKELNEKEYLQSLSRKFGTEYAKVIIENGNCVEKFDSLSKKYGKVNAKRMIEGLVVIGWTTQMCIESWGKPDDINRTTGSWGVHEQWVYGDIDASYLYFENGRLTTIQN